MCEQKNQRRIKENQRESIFVVQRMAARLQFNTAYNGPRLTAHCIQLALTLSLTLSLTFSPQAEVPQSSGHSLRRHATRWGIAVPLSSSIECGSFNCLQWLLPMTAADSNNPMTRILPMIRLLPMTQVFQWSDLCQWLPPMIRMLPISLKANKAEVAKQRANVRLAGLISF